MIAAITLLPGLLGLAGTKIDKLSIHRKSHVTKPAPETVSGRWAHHVGQHPVRYAVASFVALCVIAVPAMSMRIGTPDDGNAGARQDPAHRLRPARRGLRPWVQRSRSWSSSTCRRPPTWSLSIGCTTPSEPTPASPP